nr:DNA excision repair protein ERCC 6 [Hymenolepis microstoma]
MLIDRNKIESSNVPDLGDISQVAAVYDESVLDAGVYAQVEEALRKKSTLKEKIEQNLDNILRDIQLKETEIGKLEDALAATFDSISDECNRSLERNIRSLENEITTKKNMLNTLRKREAICLEILQKPDETIDLNNKTVADASDKESLASIHRPTVSKISKSSSRRKLADTDDADLKAYHKRLAAFENEITAETSNDEILKGGLRIPADIWNRLYPYQREGVAWLWGLHRHGVGGILGDEMGLGKTVQIIVFLASLHHSKLPISESSYEVAISQMNHTPSSSISVSDGLAPVLIVCPGTVLKQWLAEFRIWMPTARVVIIHSSGSGYNNLTRLVSSLFKTTGFALTTYGTLAQHRDLLIPLPWHYVILDEGHKVKNPQAEITATVKRFITPHRIIVSGTPMQNNLKELWCIFDFVYPGKLGGGMMDFLVNFGVPITMGGYANASPLEVETAYRCACTLKRILSPYLLRRLKKDVQLELPKKSEQVLFCHLTHYQRSVYEEYLNSRACQYILRGMGNVLGGLVLLKKLCNHPDLVTGGPQHFGSRLGEEDDDNAEEGDYWRRFGCSRRSGKLVVTLDLLALWWDQKHKVLLFTQSRKMLNILEKHASRRGYPYLRMDGATPTRQRHRLVEQFNSTKSSDCFLFLLTTRVGGLGVNLTGADRVLIYDPDWNPSTDAQARERAWRIGQQREVAVYRLLASGTLEEKVYQRQIFKQFLTNRVLKNPRQQRFFKLNSVHDLFMLNDEAASRPSDANGGMPTKHVSFFNAVGVPKHAVTDNRFDALFAANPDKLKELENASDDDKDQETSGEVDEDESEKEETSEERKARLRAQARRLSRKLVEKYSHRGTRVDGKRIHGVARRSRFDEGETEKKEGSKQSDNAKKEPDLDPFVTSVLCGSDQDEKLESFKRKRSEVDEYMKKEAKKVAETALEAIRPKKRKRHRSKDALSTVKKRLKEVTVVNHDTLMNNFLMSEKRVDPALERIQASRLANSVTKWLNTLEDRIKSSRFQVPFLGTSNPINGVIFGQVKDGFLYSPNERNCPLFLAYKRQEVILKPGEASNNLLFAGHNRLSSGAMLELIRERREGSMNFLGLSTVITNPITLQERGSISREEKELRKVAYRLLMLFAEGESYSTPSASTAIIVDRFSELLTSRKRNGRSQIPGELTGRHFRALLRSIAFPPVRKGNEDGTEVWVLKPQFAFITSAITRLPPAFLN